MHGTVVISDIKIIYANAITLHLFCKHHDFITFENLIKP